MNPTIPGVKAIAWTHFQPPDDVPWDTDTDGGQALVEFAGRACYQSWGKPNPATATNAGYVSHILTVGHFSVLEHGTATLYLTGVSRSLTHELIRHRHFSYSQLSQRYAAHDGDTVVPEVIADDPYLMRVFTEAAEHTERAYAELVHGLDRKLEGTGRDGHEPGPIEPGGRARCVKCHLFYEFCGHARQAATLNRKLARQAARAVLVNAAETRIVVTGNFRAWRHFIDMRATEHADVEIRAAAIAILEQLTTIAPNVFADYELHELPDGSRLAYSQNAERS